MKLKLIRTEPQEDRTFGKLFCGEVFICDTLEPPYEGTKKSDPVGNIRATKNGNTAIPIGEYEIDMNTVSPRFQYRSWAIGFGGIVPWVTNVPAFTRVLIHVGNFASRHGISDTNGCILVGTRFNNVQLSQSVSAFTRLMNNYLLPSKSSGDKITLEVTLL